MNAGGAKAELSTLKSALESFKTITQDLEKSINFLHDTVTALERKIDTITERIGDVDVLMADNTRLRHRVENLEKRLVKLEATKSGVTTKAKKNTNNEAVAAASFTVTITGIEAVGDEVVPKVKEIFMNLDVNYDDTVVKCNQVASSKVVFVSLKNREDLVKLIKAAKTKRPDKVFVNEKLSPGCYKLLKEAKVLRNHGFKHVWSSGGSVLARKEDRGTVSVIRAARDIEALKSEKK